MSKANSDIPPADAPTGSQNTDKNQNEHDDKKDDVKSTKSDGEDASKIIYTNSY